MHDIDEPNNDIENEIEESKPHFPEQRGYSESRYSLNIPDTHLDFVYGE